MFHLTPYKYCVTIFISDHKAPEVKRIVFEMLREYCSNLSDNVELNKVLALTKDKSNKYPAIYSAASIKNMRRTMEDRFICIEDFNGTFNVQVNKNDTSNYFRLEFNFIECNNYILTYVQLFLFQDSHQNLHFYAVFDGHNGYNAACYGASHLPFNIAKDSSFPSNPVEALRRSFLATDCNFVKKNIKSGTTALCALHYPNESKLIIAWVGDSQALLVKKGKLKQLVRPHKPHIRVSNNRIVFVEHKQVLL